MFTSILSFSIIYKSYRYRERNEVVNEQAIIEKQYERELLNISLLHGILIVSFMRMLLVLDF